MTKINELVFKLVYNQGVTWYSNMERSDADGLLVFKDILFTYGAETVV